jgi:hypothetical protein
MFEQRSIIMWVPPMHMSRTMLVIQCGYGRCPLPALRETML